MIELGAFVGAIFASFVADHYSRRNSIRAGVCFFLVGSAIQTGAFGAVHAGALLTVACAHQALRRTTPSSLAALSVASASAFSP